MRPEPMFKVNDAVYIAKADHADSWLYNAVGEQGTIKGIAWKDDPSTEIYRWQGPSGYVYNIQLKNYYGSFHELELIRLCNLKP